MTLSWNSALDHYCCWHAIYTSYYYYIAYYADSRRYICIVYSYARAHIVHNAMCEIYRSKLTRSLRVIEPLAEPTADPIQSINYNYEHIIYCTQHTYNVHMRRVKYIYFVFFFLLMLVAVCTSFVCTNSPHDYFFIVCWMIFMGNPHRRRNSV